jgi:hypothetical protein
MVRSKWGNQNGNSGLIVMEHLADDSVEEVDPHGVLTVGLPGRRITSSDEVLPCGER